MKSKNYKHNRLERRTWKYGRPQKFFQGGQRQHFPDLSQVADDPMQMYFHEMLYPYYMTATQRKCPMLQQQPQKYASLAVIDRKAILR